MAEGFVNALINDRYEAQSGGTEPGNVHPMAIQVMEEAGIDISHHRSRSVDSFTDMGFDYVVTVCDNAREACPYFGGAPIRLHQSFPDPAEARGSDREKREAFRESRDRIRSWILKEFT